MSKFYSYCSNWKFVEVNIQLDLQWWQSQGEWKGCNLYFFKKSLLEE